MILDTWLDENDTAGMDPSVVTDKIVHHLVGLSKAKLRDELSPIVFDVVSTQMRLRARTVEDAAISPRQMAPSVDAIAVDPLAARRSFLDSGFRSPARDGDWVTWGDATAEDHASYAESLRHMIAGTIRTAERHENAATIITERGVTRLSDINGFDPTELDS